MKLLIIKPENKKRNEAGRLYEVLQYAIETYRETKCLAVSYIETAAALREAITAGKLLNRRILFAVTLGDSGVNLEYYAMLKEMRTAKDCFQGSIATVVIDGDNEYYTKSVARELILTANIHGCNFVGSPLVEGTGSLKNFEVKASNMKKNTFEAYKEFTYRLIEKLDDGVFPRNEQPQILCVHASNRKTSNTLGLWGLVRKRLEGKCRIQEVSLAEENIQDCAGCNYSVCRKYGNQNECYYEDVVVQKIYPALRNCNALMLLCPNYNDALGAELTAFINRLTALYRTKPFDDKYLYAVIVSGYSGGDIVAEQLVDGLNMNKAFILPGRFALTATANAPGSVFEIPDIQKRAEKYAGGMLETLCQ